MMSETAVESRLDSKVMRVSLPSNQLERTRYYAAQSGPHRT
jgi:hypothetical protein